MISLFIFQPADFFRRTWHLPAARAFGVAAPLSCILIHGTALAIIHRKMLAALLPALPSTGSNALAVGSHFGVIFGALFYASLWVVGTGILVSTNILACKPEASYTRLLEATGLAFYSQVPYLLILLAYAFWFQAPALAAGSSLPSAEELVRQLRGALQESFLYHFVRNLGHAFGAYLVLLFVIANHSHSGGSLTRSILAGAFIYTSFYLGPQMLK